MHDCIVYWNLRKCNSVNTNISLSKNVFTTLLLCYKVLTGHNNKLKWYIMRLSSGSGHNNALCLCFCWTHGGWAGLIVYILCYSVPAFFYTLLLPPLLFVQVEYFGSHHLEVVLSFNFSLFPWWRKRPSNNNLIVCVRDTMNELYRDIKINNLS